MARRRRRNRGTPAWPVVALCLGVIAVTGWWLYPNDSSADDVSAAGDAETGMATAPYTPVSAPATSEAQSRVPASLQAQANHGASEVSPPALADPNTAPPSNESTSIGDAVVDGGSALLLADSAAASGDLIAARTNYSQALRASASPAERTRIRTELARIGDATIFSARIFDDDPLVSRYTVQVGDTMGKIAKKYQVAAELIASINGIRNVNLIRAGQVLKVINGPFHAVVTKSDYALELLLGSSVVRVFPVGLGSDDSTPTGTWRVRTKLVNPTYYPPRGGDVIAADDPENPLGERWIALEGVSGEALGALRYGIHGTIEPESIGKNLSLGCVRLHNKDVEVLYNCLVEKHSTVKIAP